MPRARGCRWHGDSVTHIGGRGNGASPPNPLSQSREAMLSSETVVLRRGLGEGEAAAAAGRRRPVARRPQQGDFESARTTYSGVPGRHIICAHSGRCYTVTDQGLIAESATPISPYYDVAVAEWGGQYTTAAGCRLCVWTILDAGWIRRPGSPSWPPLALAHREACRGVSHHHILPCIPGLHAAVLQGSDVRDSPLGGRTVPRWYCLQGAQVAAARSGRGR